jgi:vacuolar-type H+-ATPase subunit F/Vma7
MIENQLIAFIGEKEYCQSMRFIGFDCFSVFNKEQAINLIEELKKENYALIMVSQDIAPEDVGLDNVVVIPGMVKKSDQQGLKKEIIKAIGNEINLSVS